MINAQAFMSTPPSRPGSPVYEYTYHTSNPLSQAWHPEGASADEISLSSVRLSKYSAQHRAVDQQDLITSSDTYSAASVYSSSPSASPPPILTSNQPFTPAGALPSPISSATGSPEPQRRRIPRPPNAFMLFRSDCIAQIRAKMQRESGGEKRQQVFSRVAGEAWHLLPAAERLIWQQKASKAFAEHQAKYPDYKFTPSPKGTSRKGKGRSSEDGEALSVADIRAKYLNLPGAAVKNPTPRRRARKARPTTDSAALTNPLPTPSQSTHASPVPQFADFPAPQPQSLHFPSEFISPFCALAPPNAYLSADMDSSFAYGPPQIDSGLPAFFPNPSVPHYLHQHDAHARFAAEHCTQTHHRIADQRRPSTTLGFRNDKGSPIIPDAIPRPASATCNPRPVMQPAPTYGVPMDVAMPFTYPSDNDYSPNHAYFSGGYDSLNGLANHDYYAMAESYVPSEYMHGATGSN